MTYWVKNIPNRERSSSEHGVKRGKSKCRRSTAENRNVKRARCRVSQVMTTTKIYPVKHVFKMYVRTILLLQFPNLMFNNQIN